MIFLSAAFNGGTKDSMRLFLPLILLVLLLLTACNLPVFNGTPTSSSAQPTPTECGCEVQNKPTPTGGIGLPAPVGPLNASPSGTTSGADVSTYRDQWTPYTNDAFGFTFETPAAYTSQPLAFCAVRENANLPEGALLSLGLGSRTQLTLSKTAQSLPAAVDAWKAAHADFRFEPASQRSVGGVAAIIQPYRSGGTNRYAEVAFFLKDGVLYQVENAGSPSACDVPAIDLTE